MWGLWLQLLCACLLLCASLLLLQLWQRGVWLVWLLPVQLLQTLLLPVQLLQTLLLPVQLLQTLLLPVQLLCPCLLPVQDLIFGFTGILTRPSTIPGLESWAPLQPPHPPPFPSMSNFFTSCQMRWGCMSNDDFQSLIPSIWRPSPATCSSEWPVPSPAQLHLLPRGHLSRQHRLFSALPILHHGHSDLPVP